METNRTKELKTLEKVREMHNDLCSYVRKAIPVNAIIVLSKLSFVESELNKLNALINE